MTGVVGAFWVLCVRRKASARSSQVMDLVAALPTTDQDPSHHLRQVLFGSPVSADPNWTSRVNTADRGV